MNDSLRSLARLTILAVLCLLTLLVGLSPRSLAQPLPEQIHPLPVNADDGLQNAITALTKIDDASQRQGLLTRILYDVRPLESHQIQPLLRLLMAELEGLENKAQLRVSGEVLYRLEPDFVLKLCRLIPDAQQHERDICLRYYVRSCGRELAVVRPLLDEIAELRFRLECLASLASSRACTLEEVRSLLREWRQLGGTQLDLHAFAVTKDQLAESDLDAVVQLFKDELSPTDSVTALAYLAGYLDYHRQQPQLAKRVFAAAVKQIPECPDPRAATGTLLHHGLMRHEPQRAAELKERYAGSTDQVGSLLQPAPRGVDAVLQQAANVIWPEGSRKEVMEARLLGGMASRGHADEVFAWLQAAPPSELRDRAVASIAGGISSEFRKEADRKRAQEKVDLLAGYAVTIDDAELRAKACEAVYRLVASTRDSLRLVLPQAVLDAYARLWPDMSVQLYFDPRERHIAEYIGLLPHEAQVDAIRATWIAGKTLPAADLVAASTLTPAQKKDWNRILLDEAGKIAEARMRAFTLTRLARHYRHDDLAECLRITWDGLGSVPHPELERKGGWACTDWDMPLTPEECLRQTVDDTPSDVEGTVQTMCNFARQVKPRDEREAVLEAVAEILLRDGQFERAAEVTTSIKDPARQAKLWAAVAIVAHGKPLRSDW